MAADCAHPTLSLFANRKWKPKKCCCFSSSSFNLFRGRAINIDFDRKLAPVQRTNDGKVGLLRGATPSNCKLCTISNASAIAVVIVVFFVVERAASSWCKRTIVNSMRHPMFAWTNVRPNFANLSISAQWKARARQHARIECTADESKVWKIFSFPFELSIFTFGACSHFQLANTFREPSVNGPGEKKMEFAHWMDIGHGHRSHYCMCLASKWTTSSPEKNQIK